MGNDDLVALAAAFATGAGFEAIDMSMLIRGTIAAVYMIWAGWIAYKQFILMAEDDEKLTFPDFRFNMIKLSLSITLILVLVSIV